MERDAEIVALFLGASFGSFSMTWPRNGQFGLGWDGSARGCILELRITKIS